MRGLLPLLVFLALARPASAGWVEDVHAIWDMVVNGSPNSGGGMVPTLKHSNCHLHNEDCRNDPWNPHCWADDSWPQRCEQGGKAGFVCDLEPEHPFCLSCPIVGCVRMPDHPKCLAGQCSSTTTTTTIAGGTTTTTLVSDFDNRHWHMFNTVAGTEGINTCWTRLWDAGPYGHGCSGDQSALDVVIAGTATVFDVAWSQAPAAGKMVSVWLTKNGTEVPGTRTTLTGNQSLTKTINMPVVVGDIVRGKWECSPLGACPGTVGMRARVEPMGLFEPTWCTAPGDNDPPPC